MYEIFSDSNVPITAVIKPPGFDLVRRVYIREVSKIVNYYRTRPIPVKSNHLLCRILEIGMIPIKYELDRFMDIAYTRAPYLSKHFNLSSSICYGKAFNGDFYGDGTVEHIVTEEHYIDLAKAVFNWKDIRAVRVLDHSISDLNILLPDGGKSSLPSGTAVIAINIPLLLLQYRCFMMEELYGNMNVGYTLQQFIHMYVIPNMLYSHLDLAIFNRLIDRFHRTSPTIPLRKYPFYVTDSSDKLDKVLDVVLDKITDAKLSYPTYLANIPAIRMENAKDALIMPDIARTRQVWWLLLKARFRHIEFLLDVGGASGIHYNRGYINRLKVDFKRLKSQHIFETMLTTEEYEFSAKLIERVLAL